ncbi:ABC transporter substrate-binding protein [Rhodococcus erythropolis]|uniref:ABC transporter substrate-binding protein n=1 Tax=Rhodococcus erythropolis TaxID=1833 RepID=UPI0008B9E87D|nr:ABC transporter substrate-binding protein [Rhodococcus erythropolis]OFV75547.1 putative siderophore-binding lipoprotein YfiY precursor [Rhodococcus erythropolis]
MKRKQSSKKTVGLAISLSACLAILTGCGQNQPDATSTTTQERSTARTVQHAFGEATIPVSPQRVAVLDGDRTLEATVALGIDPIAAIKPPLTGDYSQAVRDELDTEPIDIGAAGAGINIETLLTAEPDLIIMRTTFENSRELYDQLQSIAPTAVVDYTEADWKNTLHQVAGFLNESDLADSLISDYDTEVARVRTTLATDNVTLTVARVRTDSMRYMTQNGSFPYSVLSDLGYRAPTQQDLGSPEIATVDVSPERLDILAADRLILLTDARADNAAAALRQNPLFANLGADVTTLPSKDYLFGSVLTAHRLIETLTDS